MGGNRIRPANVTIVKTFQKSLDTVLGTSAMDILAIDEDRNASLLIRRKSACSTDLPRQTCLDEFHREICASTTGVDRRRDGGDAVRYSSARFRHGFQDPARILLLGAHLCVGVVLR